MVKDKNYYMTCDFNCSLSSNWDSLLQEARIYCFDPSSLQIAEKKKIGTSSVVEKQNASKLS